MKPLNLIALLLFLGGAVWTLTLSDRAVRNIQNDYFFLMSPFLKKGSELETYARKFMLETRQSKDLEAELETVKGELGVLQVKNSLYQDLDRENDQLRHALGFKKSTHFDVVAAHVIRRNPTTWWQTVDQMVRRCYALNIYQLPPPFIRAYASSPLAGEEFSSLTSYLEQ
jgi:cell shape-determining protein MreC